MVRTTRGPLQVGDASVQAINLALQQAQDQLDELHNATPATTSAGLPRSYLAGLTLANNAADATNDLDIAVGAARDSGNTADLVLAAALTKQLDVAWAAGTGQGGRDTGSIANGTWFVFLIGKASDSAAADVLFSTSASAPTMPTGWDLYRRIGAILREAAAITAFLQHGDKFVWLSPADDVSAVATGTAVQTQTLHVPVGIAVDAYGNFAVSAAAQLYFKQTDQTDVAVSLGQGVRAEAASGNWWGPVMTDTAAGISSRSNGNVNLTLSTHGWYDRRGRDD